jgi:hypothetical protein
MSCEIIQFSAARPVRAVSNKRAPGALTPRQQRREGKPELPPPATETAKNSRIRIKRRDAWWLACRATEYWHARLKWGHELDFAQRNGIGDSGSFPPVSDSPFRAVDMWREAVAKQLLTPAPDLGAITWKRAKLKSSDFPHLPVKKERVERAIDDDVAFLAAHPTRRSNSEAMARSREFKEVMRQRIREIAASRGLSDEEIKPVWSLKHQRVAEFVEKHGVNFKWLYEGMGDIFKTGPKLLEAGKPVSVAATMPEADHAIRTMVCEILQERDQ